MLKTEKKPQKTVNRTSKITSTTMVLNILMCCLNYCGKSHDPKLNINSEAQDSRRAPAMVDF